jgi:hypothetical protein
VNALAFPDGGYAATRLGPMAKPTPPVAIIMGSQSDWETMRHCAETLDELEIA